MIEVKEADLLKDDDCPIDDAVERCSECGYSKEGICDYPYKGAVNVEATTEA